MAGKLVELKEAATMLGMTPDELSDLRSRGEQRALDAVPRHS